MMNSDRRHPSLPVTLHHLPPVGVSGTACSGLFAAKVHLDSRPKQIHPRLPLMPRVAVFPPGGEVPGRRIGGWRRTTMVAAELGNRTGTSGKRRESPVGAHGLDEFGKRADYSPCAVHLETLDAYGTARRPGACVSSRAPRSWSRRMFSRVSFTRARAYPHPALPRHFRFEFL